MDAYTLMVCPHDTASNPDRWYLFMQYLVQKIGTHLNFEIALDFADFHENLSKADIVYASPADSLKLIDSGFAAVAHPSNLHDEVLFVASPEVAGPTVESLNGAQIASVESLQPTKLGLHILKGKGIAPAGITNMDSWTSVVSSIWRNEAQFGFLYKDTYDELSTQGKEMVQVFYTSDEKIAFHNLLVGNNASAQKDTIATVLMAMHSDDQGKEVLKELRTEQWVATTAEQLDKMRHLMTSY